eukprot:TRINITY_DN16479_c0_g1_i1.p1 TRINITY_DN16479_c0_g1~~TRINITY_DN16479_c0_g1_i1.p1  ORF type:complete len:1072 (+),score=275.63 TRINITY_DN16479_c0_g1_i1:96-3218(+)
MVKSAAERLEDKRREKLRKADEAEARGDSNTAMQLRQSAANLQPPHIQQARSKVRSALEKGDVAGAALQCIRSSPDEKMAGEVLLSCMQVGSLDSAAQVALVVERWGKYLEAKQIALALASTSQRADVDYALSICDTIAPLCDFALDFGTEQVLCPRRSTYLKHWAHLMLMEFLAEAEACLARADGRGTGVRAGQAWTNLRAEAMQKGGHLAVYAGGAMSSLSKNDSLLLTSERDASKEYEAEVVEVRRDGSVTVKVLGAPVSVPLDRIMDPRQTTWRASKIAFRTNFSRSLGAVATLLTVRPSSQVSNTAAARVADKEVCECFLAAALPGCPTPEGADTSEDIAARSPDDPRASARLLSAAQQAARDPQLNASQREAVAAAMRRRVTLIQGPPGTGKTTTAVRIAHLWAQSGAGPVLCTSDSNTAVDNLVTGLAARGVDVCRVGRSEAVRKDLERYTLDVQVGAGDGGMSGRGMSQEQYHAVQARLRRAQVVCATCSGAGSDLVERIVFPSVLVDEAGQATEPSVLIPLMHGAKRVCLVGDHKQLPPTVISREAEKQGLDVSLFDRLQHDGVKRHLLRTQYRMHPALAIYPSAAFYDGQVGSGTPADRRRPPSGFRWPHRKIGLAFVPVDGGCEEAEGQTYSNKMEADSVVEIVRQFIAEGLKPEEIGVITPYAAQVRLLRRLLSEYAPRTEAEVGLEVNSVDGFQGREKELIVVSAVRASRSGGVGFLSDRRRMNVTLTRGRRGVVICGHTDTLLRDACCWGPWLRWAQGVGVVCGQKETCTRSADAMEDCGLGHDPEGDSVRPAIDLAAREAATARIETKMISPQPAEPLNRERLLAGLTIGGANVQARATPSGSRKGQGRGRGAQWPSSVMYQPYPQTAPKGGRGGCAAAPPRPFDDPWTAPPPWEVCPCPQTGHPYYYNRTTNESRWQKPAGTAPPPTVRAPVAAPYVAGAAVAAAPPPFAAPAPVFQSPPPPLQAFAQPGHPPPAVHPPPAPFQAAPAMPQRAPMPAPPQRAPAVPAHPAAGYSPYPTGWPAGV